MNTLRIFLDVFPPDGWNKETKVLNRDSSYRRVRDAFVESHLTQAAVFLGLPHRMLNPAQKQSGMNLVKNFFGWRDTVSTFKNIITMPFMTVMNIVLTPLKLLINIAKLATEFLPHYIEQNVNKASDFFLAKSQMREGATRAFLYLLAGTLYLGAIPFSLAYILGRAITSPNVSARKARDLGIQIGNNLMNSESHQDTVLGKIFGSIAGAISLCISVTLYTLVSPLGLQFIGAKVLPHLPGAISSFIDGAGSTLAPFFNVMAKITQFLSFDVSAVAVASYSNAAIAIAGMTAIATTLLGYQARERSSRFKVWWHEPSLELIATTQNISEEEEDTGLYNDEEDDQSYEEQANESLKLSSQQQMHERLLKAQQISTSSKSAFANTSPVVSDIGQSTQLSSPQGFGTDVAFAMGQQPARSALRKKSVFNSDSQSVDAEGDYQATAGHRM